VHGRFHHYGAARLSHLHRLPQPLVRSGSFHYEFVFRGRQLPRDLGVHAGLRGDSELLSVPPILMNPCAVRFQNLAHQQAELTIAQHCHGHIGGNADLVQDFASRRQRFDEHGLFGGDLARHSAQISLGQRQKLAEGAGLLHDAEHSAGGAMPPPAARAPVAVSTCQVDLAHHPLANPVLIVGRYYFAHEFMAGCAVKAVVAALQLEIRIADSAIQQPDQCESIGAARLWPPAHPDLMVFETNRQHIGDTLIMLAELACFEQHCRERFPIDEAIYNCPDCGGLLEVVFTEDRMEAEAWKKSWRERRTSNRMLDQSGVWRYRELLPFDGHHHQVVSLREGNTPLLDAPRAARYGGLDHITFKHQGFNPTGSFKDNGMTCGVTQAIRLDRQRVACVSTGNTSASMAAYAGAAGLDAIVFIPHGNISYGKLAQALEYGARTLQVEANFDQILALVRVLAERLGIYLLNSINPFRIEGQKSIIFEMLDQRDWNPPDWIVLPGGNLGNTSAFGKALRELCQFGLIHKLPRLAVIQAEGAAPFFDFMQRRDEFRSVKEPRTLATAIRIGDPVSWPKALHEVTVTNGVVEKVSEQEIADAKAIVGQCGIGCEPASAATLAGIQKLTRAGVIHSDDDVVAVLTGNVLKDPDYIYRYHTGQLKDPDDNAIQARFGNSPIVVPNDADAIARILES
jgi:threonine synthase